MMGSLMGHNALSIFLFIYLWLPLATINLVGDNSEFEVCGLF